MTDFARIILEEMFQFVAICEPDGTLLLLNDSAVSASGLEMSQVYGRPIWEPYWFSAESGDRSHLQELLKRAANGEFVQRDFDILTGPGGSIRLTIDFSAKPVVRDGKVKYLLLEGRNITEKKQAEIRIAEQNAELQDLYRKLKESDELKTQFFANVSHELRTPLALILGPVEKLLTSQEVAEDSKRDLEVARRNARLLLKHVNDLLDVSKIDAMSMRIHYSSESLVERIRFVASYFDVLAAEKQVKLEINTPTVLSGEIDAEKFDRILLNLLSNALKFTPRESVVRCTLAAIDNRAVLTVEDSGLGVPEHLREAIFERFRQAEDSNTRHFGGTGLGLAIAREFANMHGGTIAVDGSPLGGARFTFSFPLEAPAGIEVVENVQSGNQLSQYVEAAVLTPVSSSFAVGSNLPTVLIVEDNPEMSAFIAEVLSKEFNPVVATNGREGLERAVEIAPDVIVTDAMMPLMSGEQFVRALRRRDNLSTVPVIFLTAKADDDLRVRMLEGGAQDYMTKPFSAAELIARVRNVYVVAKAHRILEDRERLAAELQQAKKMEAIGRLAGSIAHDFNNILAAIQCSAELLMETANQPDGGARGDLEEIKHAVEQGSALTRQLLSFSRRQVLQPKPLDLRALMNERTRTLQRLLGREITLLMESDGLPAVIHADSAQIEQLLLNLVANARDAMPQGGSLIIYVKRAPKDARLPAGEFVQLTVSDTGHGMTDDVKAHVFEPFFTTKSAERGTGFGLSTVYTVVKDLSGQIFFESSVGHGTTFDIFLPLYHGSQSELVEGARVTVENRADAAILIVEDEEAIRRGVCRMLERRGYMALEAVDGIDALQVCAEMEGSIDLVLTDVVMPRMGGRVLAGELNKRYPNLPIVYMSGYMSDEVLRKQIEGSEIPFVRKPFSADSLMQVLEEALHGTVRDTA